MRKYSPFVNSNVFGCSSVSVCDDAVTEQDVFSLLSSQLDLCLTAIQSCCRQSSGSEINLMNLMVLLCFSFQRQETERERLCCLRCEMLLFVCLFDSGLISAVCIRAFKVIFHKKFILFIKVSISGVSHTHTHW